MDDHDETVIRSACGAFLPVGVAFRVGRIAAAIPDRAGAEPGAPGRMSARRLQEFAAGRTQARAALDALGAPPGPIPRGTDRGPVWPTGYVGSISHAGEIALAVAAPRHLLRAIGVDLEPATPLDAELLTRVCRPEELARPGPTADAARLGKLIFSAKESVYKCLAPGLGLFLEFEDVEIVFGAPGPAFHAIGHGRAEPHIRPETLEGRWCEAGGYLVTGAWQAA